jgi:S1-C subfamily serine protease
MRPIYLRCLTVTLVTVALAACANGFEQFYQSSPAAAQIQGKPFMELPPTKPALYAHSADLQSDAKRMAEEGYILIGTASFSGAANKVHESQAVEQGKKVGAPVVLVKSQYQGTVTSSIPFTVPGAPQVSTVNTTGTVNSYGSGGYATGNYNATSTITNPGARTTYQIPFSVVRNEYFASYWAKEDLNKARLGARAAPLPDAMRSELQRNTGVYVPIMMRGTRAFRANVLEGDVIVRIGGEEAIDPIGFDTQLTKFAGSDVVLTVIRNGGSQDIPVRLNQNP